MSKLSILKQKNKRDVDMTQGSIFRHLITFAFPLLIGNIFQQLYNTVDTWVVGNYVSNEAFSAVGTVGPVINMLIGIFLGLPAAPASSFHSIMAQSGMIRCAIPSTPPSS